METPKEPSTEELTKEELLKKYKKLLLIARQAKQAKDESTEELKKYKESEKKLKDEIATLQEVLQSSAAKQTELAEADNKLKIVSAQYKELKSTYEKTEEDNRVLKKTVKSDKELIDFLEDRILKDSEKKSIETTNQELIEKLRNAEEKYKLVEKSLADFKEKYLEEKKQYNKLETALIKLEEKSEKSSERSESRNGLQTVPETHELEEIVIENEKYKAKIEELNREIENYKIQLTDSTNKHESLYNNFVVKCLADVDNLKKIAAIVGNDFEKGVAENTLLNSTLEASHEKLSSLEKQVADLTTQNSSLLTELSNLKENSEVRVVNLNQDIATLKAALEESTSKNDAESMQEILKYQAVIEKLKEELNTLRQENQAADETFTSLQNRLQDSTRVSEHLEALLNSRCEEYDNLKFKTEAFDKILPALDKLRNDVKNSKSKFEGLKSGVINEFTVWKSDQKHLENNLIRFVEEYVKKLFDNNAELLKEMNVMNQELKERGETISKLEESNALLQTDANDSQSQNKKLSGQLATVEGDVTSLRNELEARDRVFRDMEEEIIRLRMNEGDTLSTSTISRVEESQRLVELDQSFEEKYNKLKILAAKLKKKAVELQTQLDQEREKVNRERTEFQNKITGFQNQAKILNSLQADYDALVEKSEKERKEASDLRKGLKKTCDENINLKQLVDELKIEHAAFKHEKSSFEIIKKELSAQIQALKKTIEKEQGRVKEWDKERERLEQEQAVINKKLEDEKAKHKSTLLALDEEKQKQKKQSLLSLEMADYERTVTELSKKLDTKEAQISELLASLDTQRELSTTLQATVTGLESRVSAEQGAADAAKSRQNLLQDELNALRQELAVKSSQVSDCERTFNERTLEFDALKLENSNIAAENAKLEEKCRVLQESTRNELRNLEDKRSQLQKTLERRELELEELKQEFEKYKVRAQNVLRQSQRDGSLSKQQNIEEEVVQLRASCDSLRTKLDDTVKRLKQITEDHEKAVEEKTRLVKKIQELQADNSQLNAKNAQLQAAEQKAREQYEESARLLPVQQETLAQCFKREMEELELKHKAELETIRTAQQQAEMALSLHLGRQTPHSHRRQPSTGESSHRRQPSTSFMPVKPEREALDVLMLEREACEGSESVESSSPKILPLEQLLAPQSLHSSSMSSSQLAAKLEKSENRIQHLTSLLSDAESDAARLQQLNQVLKEEIRRKERNVAREEQSDNLEYLKNVVVKFGTLPRGDERLRLVPVLNTILKFSKEEEQRMYAAARGDANGAGWGSYLGGILSGSQ